MRSGLLRNRISATNIATEEGTNNNRRRSSGDINNKSIKRSIIPGNNQIDINKRNNYIRDPLHVSLINNRSITRATDINIMADQSSSSLQECAPSDTVAIIPKVAYNGKGFFHFG